MSDIVIRSLSNDQVTNDLIENNRSTNIDDYICVLENNGAELPPEFMGLAYKLSNNINDRKYDLAILRTLGFTKRKVFSLILIALISQFYKKLNQIDEVIYLVYQND